MTATPETRLIAGCMTGTSLDGLDAALVAVTGRGLDMRANFIGMISRPLGDLRDELRHFASGNSAEPIRYLRAARRLGELHADAVAALCEQEGCKQLDFVVAHGQTIWHAPGEGVSWQLFDPWPIVRRLKVPVCYDLRQADLIAGGQGAPITPLADSILYRGGAGSRTMVINLGGICNVTALAKEITGEDIGPCNLLIDGVVQRMYPGKPYDKDGQIAATANSAGEIFQLLLNAPFFQRPRPRATGREDFSGEWLDRLVAAAGSHRRRPQDVVASAVWAVAMLIATHVITNKANRVVLAGGGVRNSTLIKMIRHNATQAQASILLSDDLSIPCEAREAMGFAVLGALSQDGVAITLPRVTGAKAPGRAGGLGLSLIQNFGFGISDLGFKERRGAEMDTHRPRTKKSKIQNPKSKILPPPDRGHLATEHRLAASSKLDTLSTRQILKLINDQDTAVAAAVRRATPGITRLVAAVERAFRNDGRLIYLGAGTSGRLGVLDASECPPTYHTDPSMVVGVIAGGDSALRKSSEGAEDDFHGADAELRRLKINRRDVVVGIAAGGSTPYVWGGLRFAKSRGAITAIVTCVRLSQVLGLRTQVSRPDHVIELLVGPEVITGSTRMKAGTATKLVLNMITAASMVRIGKTWGNLMVDLRATNAKLIDRAARIIVQQTNLSRLEAISLLHRAGGRVKVALIMARGRVSITEATRLLAHRNGQLRPILGPPA